MPSPNLETRIRGIIESFDAEERSLMETIEASEIRLSQVRTARASLLALIADEPLTFEGTLAEAIRTVLKNRKGSLSPTEVRDHVKSLGYDMKDHSNEMAAIHGVLKRLVDAGEVKTKEWKNAPGTRYYWNPEKPSPTLNRYGQIAAAGGWKPPSPPPSPINTKPTPSILETAARMNEAMAALVSLSSQGTKKEKKP
jgi:hypothetical protein